jgi:uncharacterized protein
MTSSDPGNVLSEQPVTSSMDQSSSVDVVVGAHRHAPTPDIAPVGDGLRPSPTPANPTDPFSSRPRRSSLPAQALMLGITGYQKYLSPLKGAPSCRFVPSCSSYALEAIRVHGAAKGTVLATIRVLKCQPLHPGGFDPVPEPGMWKSKPRVSANSGF